jgi:hypothetical protein
MSGERVISAADPERSRAGAAFPNHRWPRCRESGDRGGGGTARTAQICHVRNPPTSRQGWSRQLWSRSGNLPWALALHRLR